MTPLRFILGRSRESNDPSDETINIGRFYALDSSLGGYVDLDISSPHIILVCGKRGYGKTYTLGVLTEELLKLREDIRRKISIVIIDTLGVFWTLGYPNNRERKLLEKWGLKPEGVNVTVYITKNEEVLNSNGNIRMEKLRIKTCEITPEEWCYFLNIEPLDPLGIILTKTIMTLREQQVSFNIPDILSFIQNSSIEDYTKNMAETLLSFVDSLGIFSDEGLDANDLTRDGEVTVFDLSYILDEYLKTSIAGFIGRKIFSYQIVRRKQFEGKWINNQPQDNCFSMIWLIVDEAQSFIPRRGNPLSRKVFIENWLRQGRQPGLSMILATQHPSLLDQEVLSHSDLIISHRLTSRDDIEALSKLRPTYMSEEIEETMSRNISERGVALVIDDNSESTHTVKIKPRRSWHGGAEPRLREI